jgi:transposase
VQDAICEKYLSGLKSREIAQLFGVCIDTIYQVIKRRGIKTQRKQIESVVSEKYLCGFNAIEIAEELGCCKDTVYNLLKKQNISRRPLELSLRKYDLNVSYFNKIDSEQKAYWLGFITADGGIVNSRLTIKLATKDKSHLEKFVAELETDQPIFDTISDRKGTLTASSYICISSKLIVNDLKKYGIIPNKSLREVYYNCSSDLQRHYLRGLFDGDGSIGKVKYGWLTTMCGSNGLINEFKNHLVEKLNVKPQKLRCQKNLWYLSFGKKNDVKLILNYLYGNSNISLDRKLNLYKQATL